MQSAKLLSDDKVDVCPYFYVEASTNLFMNIMSKSKHTQYYDKTHAADVIIYITKNLMPSFQLPFDPRKPLINKDSLIGKLEKYPFFQSFSNCFPTIFPTAFWNENFPSA